MINFFGIVHLCGGCGTEMLGAIELLRSRDVPVRCILPPGDTIIEPGNPASDYLRTLGVELVHYEPGIFKECGVLMNFGEENAFDLMRNNNDRPAYSVWSSCMHYACDTDIDPFREGLIDEFFFQNDSHGSKAGPQIARAVHRAVPYRKGYMAYFPLQNGFIKTLDDRSDNEFRVGKIGRDDPEKYHSDTWKMFGSIVGPIDTPVKIEVMGWGPRAEEKIGNPCKKGHPYWRALNLEVQYHTHDPEELAKFWSRQHALVHVCAWSWEESCGRVILEALANGAVPITDNRGGPAEYLQNGVTGWLVDSWEEAAFRASEMAFYPERRLEMARAGREWLEKDGHGNADKCWPWWEFLVEKGK
jgi:glycosyltransferase involved in cell wall biosynthesis